MPQLRYPKGSEAYFWQLSHSLIASSAAVTLPVHPLPLYFGATALGTLFVLLRLLRQNAPPGSLLLAFAVLRPASKLALEQLRAFERPEPLLMLGIPAATLVAALATLAVIGLRRLRATGGAER